MYSNTERNSLQLTMDHIKIKFDDLQNAFLLLLNTFQRIIKTVFFLIILNDENLYFNTNIEQITSNQLINH